ncbi:MAG TPA: hypothetical protein VFI47_29910, partial [Acidimicrobiales bacterium]|nr:hypothetical protein [Acidimicrobiales bacterium]
MAQLVAQRLAAAPTPARQAARVEPGTGVQQGSGSGAEATRADRPAGGAPRVQARGPALSPAAPAGGGPSDGAGGVAGGGSP